MQPESARTESTLTPKVSQSKKYPSKNYEVARAFAKGIPGADRRVLERVAEASLRGEAVPPELQKIANCILGVVLLNGKLPAKAPGRPKDELFALKGVEIAYSFFSLLDQSIYDRGETLRMVAKQVNASERHVERAVHDYAWIVGGSSDADVGARSSFRALRATLSKEEYQQNVLLELRFQAGDPPTGHHPEEKRFATAPDQVRAMRSDLLRLVLATGEETENG